MVTGAQEPRVKVIPEGEEHPRWDDICAFVKRLGYELDPWQWMVLRAALMRNGDQWAAFTIGVCAPRQNGKNSLLEVLELVKALLLEERLIIHTAHLADTSNEGFHRLDELIDANDWVNRQVKHIWRTNGKETIEFKGGRRIRFRTRTRGGGRGFAGCSTAIFDEAMFLPEVSLGSILPVISASPDPQIYYTGSAVDQEIMEDGVAFARVRERALDGDHERLAYFEWSLEADAPEEIDPEDAANPESWAATNPAFGRRIKPAYVKEEIANLDPRTFAVERLGVGDWPPTTAQSVIGLGNWNELHDAKSSIAGPVVFAFDVSIDRSAASIAAAGLRTDGLWHVEIVDKRRGANWIVPRIKELVGRHETASVFCDTFGQAGSLISELEDELGPKFVQVSSREHAFACGHFFDLVEGEKVRHLGTPEMLRALRGAQKRPLGEAWAWSRKNSAVDISPLVAATIALWGASVAKPTEVFASAW